MAHYFAGKFKDGEDGVTTLEIWTIYYRLENQQVQKLISFWTCAGCGGTGPDIVF